MHYKNITDLITDSILIYLVFYDKIFLLAKKITGKTMEQTLNEIETKIKEFESRIALYQRQLKDHEEGVRKLTPMVKTSSETKLENTLTLLETYKDKQKELLSMDSQELIKKDEELLKARKKEYFDNQVRRIKYNKEYSKKIKREILQTIKDIDSISQFDDEELFDMASISLKLEIRDSVNIFIKYETIKKEFYNNLEDIDLSIIDDNKILNEHIPLIILNFSVLLDVLREGNKKSKKRFMAFPKYEDWWISELWSSHLAYFALYRWKEVIKNMCHTSEQKEYWEIIFKNWVNTKRVLSQKGSKAYNYTLVFDRLMSKYVELEEELEDKNIENLESIIKRVALRENYAKVIDRHNVITKYLEFKKQ